MNNNDAIPTAIPVTTSITTVDPILAASRGALIVSKLRVRFGRFELTRRRLTFFQFPAWTGAFGLLGALFMRYMSGKPELRLDLAQIATIVRGAYGRNKRVMNIQMVDGTVHRVIVDKFDDLSAQLHDAMGGRGLALAA